GVDGNRRLAAPELASHPGVDVAELTIAIRMPRTLSRLAICLQAVSQIVQQLADKPITGVMVLSRQLTSQQPRTLAGPSQRRLGVPPTHGIHQRLQRRSHPRIDDRRTLASAPSAADTPRVRTAPRLRLLNPSGDRAPRDTSRVGHQGRAPITERPRFGSRPKAARPLVQRTLERPKLLANHLKLRHSSSIALSGHLCHLFSRRPLASPCGPPRTCPTEASAPCSLPRPRARTQRRRPPRRGAGSRASPCRGSRRDRSRSIAVSG